ncbi:hypothetical protein M2116_000800 [Aurantimicrobium minutum]|nr:hypothetical protein [Aurantimicrobium minutum]
MTTIPETEQTEDFENLTTSLDGSLVSVEGTICSRCLYPLITHAEITRRLHWGCSLTD